MRTGLLSPATRVEFPEHGPLRLTVPARERLAQMGNRVAPWDRARGPLEPNDHRWRVTLSGAVPHDLVVCRVGEGAVQCLALRLMDEPTFPDEYPPEAVAWWERGDFVGCPECGSALVWCEAGYVPGYRVCTNPPHHHVQLSRDGCTAKAIVR